ncbi:hypothetical protein A3G56_01155 [Candidatus Falkowbacteria bacterium RIFCSPLOWO2_12_FULL_45_10]|uniref:PLD phosphodiesterase domain-containing protein n=3 Tax=Parcubacteria group TaxID=1794811 RepID=A0A1F5RXM3_9BACT|nr:MAG: hypothetical protein A3G56_01155 [Candidatus Falkowbacteria bacterium RIFCSPLOWO2_12_FULL_45_10]OGF20162.1 MAG: hypothetical protein A3I35_00905 [Candidatus Falkowbacteria bacterium RIFCSPLOWO2_02_FULL_45_15]
MLQIIKSPWEDIFVSLLQGAKQNVYLASPFIKKQTAELIIKNCNRNLDFRYMNCFKLSNFYQGASDLAALKVFEAHQVKQKNVPNLHAKFFIFDNKAVITSGNLTAGGLRHNLEYGVMAQGAILQKIKNDYLNIFNNKVYPAITIDIINKAEEIIASVPKEKRFKIKVSDQKLFAKIIGDENPFDMFNGGVESIRANLTSWKKDVFECLLLIKNDVFTAHDIYSFNEHLQKLYPNNKHINDKIRQQLQYLRDIGLIEFVKKGVYKKLWV